MGCAMDVLDYLYPNGEKKVEPLPKKDTKTDVEGFYKSPSGAVISKDNDALRQYKLRKFKDNKLNTMEQKVSKIETDISEIKELLKGLIK
jgi:hypothetical protein